MKRNWLTKGGSRSLKVSQVGTIKPEHSNPSKHPLEWAGFAVACLALVAAAAAAFFAYAQVEVAKDTAQRQLRAYVVVKPGDIAHIVAGSNIKISSTVENLGQTPVYGLHWVSGIGIAEYPLKQSAPTMEACATLAKSPDSKQLFFGKEAQLDRESAARVTDVDLQNLKEGKSAIYLVGRTCYRDIFDQQHYTDFCAYWQWEEGKLGPAYYCHRGNRYGSE